MRIQQTAYLTVTQVNQLLQAALDDHVPSVNLQGEISEITAAASGHFYFTLKDEQAQISAVIWRGNAAMLGFELKTGLHVLCQGRPAVYQKRGSLQIIVHRMIPAGEGMLQQRFFELKKKLGNEGLFALERKRELPFLPSAVGVVTSGTGAVIHDIMVKIRERMPSLKVYLVDVRVQGEGAAGEIAGGVNLLNDCRMVDVIIIARGGGSLEDLWAFNEEVVVRAIAASSVPVVSGVGHEVDITLSDLAADVRAPTPTAAAEKVVPRRDELTARVTDFYERLQDTDRWLLPKAQQLDDVALDLKRSFAAFCAAHRARLDRAMAYLRVLEPHHAIQVFREKLSLSAERLSAAAMRGVEHSQHRVETLWRRLEALSPMRVLERGFAVVQSKKGILTKSAQAAPGEGLSIYLADGALEAEVRRVFNQWNECEKE